MKFFPFLTLARFPLLAMNCLRHTIHASLVKSDMNGLCRQGDKNTDVCHNVTGYSSMNNQLDAFSPILCDYSYNLDRENRTDDS